MRGESGDDTEGPADHESLAEVFAEDEPVVDGVAEIRRMVGIGFGWEGDSTGAGDIGRLIGRDRKGNVLGISVVKMCRVVDREVVIGDRWNMREALSYIYANKSS